MKWGLIPFWAKDPKIGVQMINIPAETVTEKPAFRNALKRRRCLVLATATTNGRIPLWARSRFA